MLSRGVLVSGSVHQCIGGIISDESLEDVSSLRLIHEEIVDGSNPVAAISPHCLLDLCCT